LFGVQRNKQSRSGVRRQNRPGELPAILLAQQKFAPPQSTDCSAGVFGKARVTIIAGGFSREPA
jgi:hypothetical protein